MTDIKIKLKSEIYNIDYIHTNDNNYKFTFGEINWSTLTTSYKCSDYLCNGRLSIIYEYTNDLKKNVKKKITETKEHSILREDHTYIIKEEVKESLKTNSTIIIIKRCANPIFLKHFLINYCIRKNILNIKGNKLVSIFEDIYGKIKLDYSKLNINQKTKYLSKYKKNNNIKNNEVITIEKALTIETIANSVAKYIYNFKKKMNHYIKC